MGRGQSQKLRSAVSLSQLAGPATSQRAATLHTVAVAELLGTHQVDQVGIVVRDLEESLRRYSSFWRLGEWRCYTYSPRTVVGATYRGQPGTYAMMLALAGETPQVELIEPLAGPSIYHEWLETHGEGGVHHLGVFVDDLQSRIQSAEEAGLAVIQSGFGYGADGSGGFAYLDTLGELGTIVELIEVPAVRRPPDKVWEA